MKVELVEIVGGKRKPAHMDPIVTIVSHANFIVIRVVTLAPAKKNSHRDQVSRLNYKGVFQNKKNEACYCASMITVVILFTI